MVKCDYSFSLKGIHLSGDCWRLSVPSGRHSHAIQLHEPGGNNLEMCLHKESSHDQPITIDKLCSEQPSDIDRSLSLIPSALRHLVDSVIDVPGDGNCGFRALAIGLGYAENDGFRIVRRELMDELVQHAAEYRCIFGDEFENVRKSLSWKHASDCKRKYWMQMPETGYLAASRWNKVIVYLNLSMCLTFFPLRSAPPPIHSEIPFLAIGHINGDHYIHVTLKPECPLPGLASFWEKFRCPEAEGWATYKTKNVIGWAKDLSTRMVIWKAIILKDIPTTDTIHID